MIIAVDTNVISELTKPEPEPKVVNWVFEQQPDTLVIPSICLAELSRGVRVATLSGSSGLGVHE